LGFQRILGSYLHRSRAPNRAGEEVSACTGYSDPILSQRRTRRQGDK